MAEAASRRTYPRWSWMVLALLVLPILLWAAPRTSLNDRSLVTNMVDGTAYRPYVQRALVGLVVRGADALLPAPARTALEGFVARNPALAERLGWKEEHASWYAIVFLLHGLSLFVFAIAFRRLVAHTFRLDGVAASVAAIGGLGLVPIHFGYQNFVYDFPVLALLTTGLVLIAERRWTLFYLLWPVGLLNKETFILLVPVFLLSERNRMPRTQLLVHGGIQFASAIGMWLAIGWVFRDNPGGATEWHLMRNLTYVPSGRQLLHDVIYWGAWACGLLFWWEKRALALRALTVIGVLVGTTFFLGYMGEYRDFYEAWPLLALLLAQTAFRLVGRRLAEPDPAGGTRSARPATGA